MTAGVYAIPTDVGVAVQNYIIDEIRDKYPMGLVPMVTVEGQPYTSRIPYMESLKVSMGIMDVNAHQAAANASLKYLDVSIAGRQVKIAFSARDLRRSGADVVNAKNKTILSKFLDEVDNAFWHGNYEGGVLVGAGLISQMTNVAADITAAQATAQVVFANMKTMVQKIAPEYRSQYPIAFLIDWQSYDLATTGIATGFTVSAMEVFKKAYPSVTVIPTNTILATAANIDGGTDTVADNGRMLCFAQNQDLVRDIVALAPSPAGPAIVNLAGNIDQLWATLWGSKVIQATATAYTGTVLTF